MSITLTNAQWEKITGMLERILAELMLRQPLDANVAKRLSNLEKTIAELKTGKAT